MRSWPDLFFRYYAIFLAFDLEEVLAHGSCSCSSDLLPEWRNPGHRFPLFRWLIMLQGGTHKAEHFYSYLLQSGLLCKPLFQLWSVNPNSGEVSFPPKLPTQAGSLNWMLPFPVNFIFFPFAFTFLWFSLSWTQHGSLFVNYCVVLGINIIVSTVVWTSFIDYFGFLLSVGRLSL